MQFFSVCSSLISLRCRTLMFASFKFADSWFLFCLAETRCYAPQSTVTGSIGQVIQLPTNEGCNRTWAPFPGGPSREDVTVGVEVNATNISTNPQLSEFYQIIGDRTHTFMRLYVRGNLLCINF